MAFSDIPEIRDSSFFLDTAFGRAKKIGVKNQTDPFLKQKLLLYSQIDCVKDSINSQLSNILKTFPSIDSLEEFYEKLVKATMDYAALKKALGAVNWGAKKVSELSEKYKQKARQCTENRFLQRTKKEYYGRISSVLKQIDSQLSFLEKSRKVFRDFPAIKTSLFTICISGFPNVGKSTLLSKITTASPEIKEYPFTTKKLNLGYFEANHISVQVIDTPGTLNRLSVMNNIEKQAFLALKYLAHAIVYIYDLTEEYDIIDQHKLFDNTLKNDKKTMVYLSKTDILEKEAVERFTTEFNRRYNKGAKPNEQAYIQLFTDPVELKKRLSELFISWKKQEFV
ncbi:MAG: GTPase [Candidatus Woesearchaeota archaeon]